MELYFPRLLPPLPSHLFFLIVTACCASLLIPCSVCFDAQYEYCQSTGRTCGSMNITYPFGVGNRGCGLPGSFQIDCVHNSSPVIEIHGRYYTILDFYSDPDTMVISRNKSCQFLDDPINIGPGYADTVFKIISQANWNLNLVKCSKSIEPGAIQGQTKQCNATVYYSLSLDNPFAGYSVRGCTVQQVPVGVGKMKWVSNDTKRNESCTSCQTSGGICGYSVSDSTAAAPFLCYCKDGPRTDNCSGHGRGHNGTCGKKQNFGSHRSWGLPASLIPVRIAGSHFQLKKNTGRGHKSMIIIIGCSFGGVALTAIALLFLRFYAKRRRTQSPGTSASQVEKFLREYAHEMPARYSHSQLKKITNNFAERLGEGGYGVVYKGKFRNGTLVAVKLLDRQRHSEAQFMNEVATIGRVHHVNLVRLLGYCFESFTNCALVYEYMLNGSLDKFIFSRKEKGQLLSWAQLYSIALGAARGIAYLHQDCQKRIIHFDIKPHNILLDAEFIPKVSDFGLAKLCGKGEDHVSMTGGRGTPGYVAPELCDGDLGPVTDKSDVYSFGMLLLEIVGGRKNIDWKASRSSQFYFPEWAFKLLESGELGMILRGGEMEAEDEDEKNAARLTKIGMWCIQYKSTDRPSMSRIVEMLQGDGDDVANPPLPFNISSAAVPERPLLSSTTETSPIEISEISL